MRRRLTALALPAVAALAIGACSSADTPSAIAPPAPAPAPGPETEPPTTEDPTTEDPTTEDPTTEDPTTEDPTTEPPANGGGDDELGLRRDNPVPLDTVVTIGDWEVSVGATNQDAWSDIEAENMFNDAPDEGHNYILVPITATYNGPDTGSPWIDLSIEFVGTDAVTYSGYCGVVPNSLMNVRDLYEGGTGTGNECAMVMADAIDGGVWRIEESWNWDEETARFFASS